MKKDRYIPPHSNGVGGQHWKLKEVLIDGKGGGFSCASGWWCEKPCIGVRWNGEGNGEDEDGNIGFPQTFGHPVWLIIEEEELCTLLSALMKEAIKDSRLFSD